MWGGIPRLFPSQMASNAKSVLMFWRHHVPNTKEVKPSLAKPSFSFNASLAKLNCRSKVGRGYAVAKKNTPHSLMPYAFLNAHLQLLQWNKWNPLLWPSLNWLHSFSKRLKSELSWISSDNADNSDWLVLSLSGSWKEICLMPNLEDQFTIIQKRFYCGNQKCIWNAICFIQQMWFLFQNNANLRNSEPVLLKMMTILRDDEWKRVRSLLTPTFSSGKLKQVRQVNGPCWSRYVRSLRPMPWPGTTRCYWVSLGANRCYSVFDRWSIPRSGSYNNFTASSYGVNRHPPVRVGGGNVVDDLNLLMIKHHVIL